MGWMKKPEINLLKVLGPVVLILMVVVGALSIVKMKVGGQRRGQSYAQVGQVVPDFTLKRLGGGEMRYSEGKAKIVLINFWATWCEACMIEMPSIVKLREKFKDKGFEVYAIDLDDQPEKVAPPVIARLGMKFPIFTDKENVLSDLFNVHAIPLSVILDRSGKILFSEPGEMDWSSPEVEAEVSRWLAQ